MNESILGRAARLANRDPEFRLVSRGWSTVLRFDFDPENVLLEIRDGQALGVRRWRQAEKLWTAFDVRLSGPADGWEKLLRPEPPPFYQDLWGAAIHHGFRIEGRLESLYPYYPALRRLMDLTRTAATLKGDMLN